MSGDIEDLYGQPVEGQRDEKSGDFECLPAGWYSVQIDAKEIKDTKPKPNKPTGKYLWLKLTVIGERYTNRKLFTNITLMNASAEAVKIGQRKLGALTLACGLSVLRESDELLGKQIDVRIKIKKGNAGYGDDNDVTAFEPLGTKRGGAPAAPPQRQTYSHPGNPPQQSAAAAPAGPKKLPWQ